MSNDPSAPHFWQSKYDEQSTNWDLGGPTPAFVDLYERGTLTPGAMIVLGAGRGYDPVFFASKGFDVTAVDFADSAAAATKENAAAAQVTLTVLQQDMFTLDASHNGKYDYLLEYTCYCAIDPSRRAEYVALTARLVRPGGLIIALMFPVEERPGGPPFGVSLEEADRLYGKWFDLVSREESPLTIEPRKGRELLAKYRRRNYE
jgi:SAM-dependent methyltransferase